MSKSFLLLGCASIHPSLAAWWCRVAGRRSGPALPSSQPSVKTTPTPSPPPFFPAFIYLFIYYLRCPSVLLLLIYGRFMWETGESRAGFILFSSDRLVVLASKESGSIDGKVNNAPNGVHVNIIKRCHVQWTHSGDSSVVFDVKRTSDFPPSWLQQHWPAAQLRTSFCP